ncbi:DUF4235 domain-containing protein [Streptomyces bauhiniae]
MAKNKTKKKLSLTYKPVGFVMSWAGGALAGLAFRKAWMAIRHEERSYSDPSGHSFTVRLVPPTAPKQG